jgi:anionic cell wall polymer biosynthesis LytR-Cps2A-Psr (LCP) family protein
MEQLGEMLGIGFDYYAEIELPAFPKIVDILGGVWIDVPYQLVYHDPDQDLNINIQAGMQLLNGQQAEGLVRFRSYPSGDLGRNAVQMEFIKQLLRQALTKEAVMRDPLGIINVVLSDVRHTVGADALRYLPYINDIKTENIRTYTMPGEGKYIGDVSYFVADENRLADIIHEVFYSNTLPQPETETDVLPKPSHGLRIQVLNGSRVAGLGSAVADTLTRDGYTVKNTDSFTGSHENATRIQVRDANTGDDLLNYFKNATISRNSSMNPEYDIIIIVGRGEQ